jgi:hypothetical protein
MSIHSVDTECRQSLYTGKQQEQEQEQTQEHSQECSQVKTQTQKLEEAFAEFGYISK